MGDGNYSLHLSPFFLYNRDTDNVGEQSFNDCFGQLTNVDDALIVALSSASKWYLVLCLSSNFWIVSFRIFGVSNCGCTTPCLPLTGY